jgi:hypothetical protein
MTVPPIGMHEFCLTASTCEKTRGGCGWLCDLFRMTRGFGFDGSRCLFSLDSSIPVMLDKSGTGTAKALLLLESLADFGAGRCDACSGQGLHFQTFARVNLDDHIRGPRLPR